jgi:hypothetical protein
MLIAEDLLLLLTDDVTGKPVVDGTRLELVLAGALLLELTTLQRVDVSGPGEPVRAGRVVVRDPAPTGDQVLDEGLARLHRAGPKKPESILSTLKKGLRDGLLQRLVERGILRSEEGRILGIFPTQRWPAADSTHERQVREGLYAVLVVGRTPSQREASLVSLLQAADAVPKVLTRSGVPAGELRRRAKAIAAGEYAGAAVKKAIDAIQAATVAAVMAATAATTAGS